MIKHLSNCSWILDRCPNRVDCSSSPLLLLLELFLASLELELDWPETEEREPREEAPRDGARLRI